MPEPPLSECVVLSIGPDGRIAPKLAKLDGHGGVHLDGKRCWVARPEDWGTFQHRDPKATFGKPKDLPAILAYHNVVHPIPLRFVRPKPTRPDERLRDPESLQDYLDADHLAKMNRAARGDKRSGLGDALKKIPGWAWLAIISVIIVVVTLMQGGGDAGGLLDRLK